MWKIQIDSKNINKPHTSLKLNSHPFPHNYHTLIDGIIQLIKHFIATIDAWHECQPKGNDSQEETEYHTKHFVAIPAGHRRGLALHILHTLTHNGVLLTVGVGALSARPLSETIAQPKHCGQHVSGACGPHENVQ